MLLLDCLALVLALVLIIGRGVYDIVTGNPGEGTKDVIRNLPFMRLWFLKGLVNNMTRAIETELDGPSGFGRY